MPCTEPASEGSAVPFVCGRFLPCEAREVLINGRAALVCPVRHVLRLEGLGGVGCFLSPVHCLVLEIFVALGIAGVVGESPHVCP